MAAKHGENAKGTKEQQTAKATRNEARVVATLEGKGNTRQSS